jgi:alkylhydroperoxidase family enzyme
MSGQLRAGVPANKTGHLVRDSSLGLVPETLDAILPLHGGVWHSSSLKPAFIEMLRLRNARTVNCTICKSVRYDVAKQDGLTEAKVAQIDNNFRDSDLEPAEKLLIAFADIYLLDPQAVDPKLIADLRQHFSEQQICHMAIALTTFHAMSRCAVSLAGMPDSLPIMEIPLPAA